MAIRNSSIFFSFFFLLFSLLICFVCSLEEANSYEGEKETRNGYNNDQQHMHVVQLSSILLGTVCSTSNSVSTQGVNDKTPSLKIVDKHGPCSHLSHEKTKTPSEILLQDQYRVNSLHSKLNPDSKRDSLKSSEATLPAKTGRSLGTGNYIVTVGFGTPKKQLSVIFDTGSDLTWIQCEPCVKYCYTQQEPTFDPSESASYSNITCNSDECSQLTSATGNTPGCSVSSSTCIYGIQYGDQSFSVGFFGRETLTLTRSEVFPNFLFGCGQNNRGLFGSSAGVLGLGRNKVSLVSQTTKKYGGVFSYCLPSTASSDGYLKFGKSRSGSSSKMKFTPLLTNSQSPSFYFLDMIAISVGGRKLPISASMFSNSGTIIDSGTVITRLPPAAYSALSSGFKKLMAQYPSAPDLSILDTCFDLSKYDTVTIPKIALFFRGGAIVDVDPLGILYAGSATQVCLAFAGNSDSGDVAIFGNKQQQRFDVVYDLKIGRIQFGAGGCS